jgi:hypothetical protein
MPFRTRMNVKQYVNGFILSGWLLGKWQMSTNEKWIWGSSTINPLTTIRHICPTIFGPRRMCGYLKIAHERLKIWKQSAATFCFSWNCASNEPNYRSIAIVVPKICAVKVSRCLSEKSQKSQNLMVFKGLTWAKFWTKNS